MKHRKLFLPASESNQTDNSDPSCPYGCDPYSDFYFSPPPPSPPPPPPPPLATKHGDHLMLYVIIIVTLLGSVFLLLSYYAIMVKYRSRFWRSSAQSDNPDEEFLDHNHGPIIDHPIWYINTIGLQQSVINSITVVKYNKGDSLIEGTDCSVCLNEFVEDETLRLLPKCNHAFHIPCIDTWLRSHTNCPLCRAGIISNTWNVALASNDPISQNLDSNEHNQTENFRDDSELERIQAGDGEVFENRTQTEEIDTQLIEDERRNTENLKDENELVIEKVIQPIRRSVSMDGAAESIIFANMFDASKGNLETSRIISTHMMSSSIQESIPASMKRSFSYGGRSVFSSRH